MKSIMQLDAEYLERLYQKYEDYKSEHSQEALTFERYLHEINYNFFNNYCLSEQERINAENDKSLSKIFSVRDY